MSKINNKNNCRTTDTDGDLRKICNEACRSTPKDSCQIKTFQCCPQYVEDCYNPRYDPGLSYFTSIVMPLENLEPYYSGAMGSVEFRMRRKNKTVSLQWEQFTGNLSIIIDKLTVSQSISNTPPYPLKAPIMMKYNDTLVQTFMEINPHMPDTKGNIFFYLKADGTSLNITMSTPITVYASCISWIVD
jgi:hypothetical protein